MILCRRSDHPGLLGRQGNQPCRFLCRNQIRIEHQVIKQGVIDILAEELSHVSLPGKVFPFHMPRRLLVAKGIGLGKARDSFISNPNKPDMKRLCQPGGHNIGGSANHNDVPKLSQVQNCFGGLSHQQPRRRMKTELLRSDCTLKLSCKGPLSIAVKRF